MKINPTLDKIVVKKIEFEKLYKGSIILTSKNQDNINKLIYEVVECGPGGIITLSPGFTTISILFSLIIPPGPHSITSYINLFISS